MNSGLTKKVVIIFSVLLVIVISAIIVAYTTGNHPVPQLSNPDEVFYQRTDEEGNVIYSITNEELYEEIKGNDGLDQLLYMIDEHLLQDYVSQLTDAEIAERIKYLTYGTADDDEINALDEDTKAEYEATFAQSMVLAGYSGHEEDYARIVLAREAYVRYALDADGDVTDMDVADEYVSNYYKDIMAIKIRFTSSADALDVLRKYNLVTYSSTTLRQYLGYVYTDETIVWDNDGNSETDDVIADAYITVTPYYFDSDSGDILDLDEEVVYEKGDGNVYTDDSDNEYTLEDGALLDEDDEVVIEAALLFESLEDAETYKEENTSYFTITKLDAFDEEEEAEVRDENGDLAYTVAFDGTIYDLSHEDVTDTTDLILNKKYKAIASMGTVTVNNSLELTDEEVLAYYIKMYNYVYAEQRASEYLLDESADAQDLIDSGNPYLTHNFTEVQNIQTNLATYMFDTLDISDEDAVPYSAAAKVFAGTNDTSYYLVYKLKQPAKVDAYQIMLDYIEANIHLPEQTVDDLVLPTTGWYSAKITWTSEDEDYITDEGVVTLPTDVESIDIEMTYKITANSVSRTGTITVTVLAGGETSAYNTSDPGDEPTFREILDDPTVYLSLYHGLIEDMITDTDNSETTINGKLAAMRADCGFKIYDSWLTIDYQDIDDTFVGEKSGSKTVVASLDSTIGYQSADLISCGYDVTADELFDYTLTKNPALYVLYASQYKELLYSPFFVEAFGTQREIQKNNSDRMDEMYQSVSDAKDYYVYLQQLYASYGLTFSYTSFSQYAYLQYGTKSEVELLQYFIQGELQPYLIAEAIDNYDLVDLLYPTVVDDFQHFFSLDVTHLLIYLDFDEDGTNDDYYEYLDSLTTEEADLFETKLAGFETAILEYLDDTDNTFETLITEYLSATREDETWGEFKRYGFCLLTEDLDTVDEDDDTITYSVTYSGTYGVKDTYVPEFVDALVELYNEYTLVQNIKLSSMMSSLVTTEFGLHYILVEQGDDFSGFSAKFEEDDPDNPVYSEGVENASDQPTLEQLKLYALYYFYNIVYDLTDTDVEEKYGITVPNIPATVRTALEFYFDDLCSGLYVIGTLNVDMGDRLASGQLLADGYGITDADFKAALAEVKDVYYSALFDQYE
jgi:hypothetical protein